METGTVLYTDGRDVTVTDSVLHVRRKYYHLEKISKHGYSIIRPARFPGIMLLTLGCVLTLAGMIDQVDPKLTFLGKPVDGHWLTVAMGILLVTSGVLMIALLGERYALSITTDQGKKNVVVSRRKDYITQIVHALNEAFFARIDPGLAKPVRREFQVSAR